jgi:serine/threonine-protein kinase
LVKIIDWGLARIRVPMPVPEQTNGRAVTRQDTEKGVLTGTADYVSPEQARNASIVDTRSDIYSLGCTFVYLLTGEPPFPGRTLMQKLLQHQQAPPPPLRVMRPDVPEELEQIVHKMMAKDPADRYQIPLLVVSPLRKFGPGALAGSVIRTPGSGLQPILKGVAKPATTLNAARPATNPSIRPPASNNGTQTH